MGSLRSPHMHAESSRGGSRRMGGAGAPYDSGKVPDQKDHKRPWKLTPEILALLKPRTGILALGFLLMLVNRVSGLILPASTKFLLDNVLIHHQMSTLKLIILAVIFATILQGLTSYSLTQLLSKSSQRMITELRIRVQAHIGKLPVSFYDANRTGVLVSRIM